MPQPPNALLREHKGRLQLALEGVKSSQFRSHYAAAAALNVNCRTLSCRAQGTPFRAETLPNSRKLTSTEEQTIVRYILCHGAEPLCCWLLIG
jgi:hypothetical protein